MNKDNTKIYGIILIVLAALVFLSRYLYLTDMNELIYLMYRYRDWVIIIVCFIIGIQLVRTSGDAK